MERARRMVGVLRNHWKKSVFLAVAAGYGASWYSLKLEHKALLAQCCREALSLGSQTQGVNDPSYHVTVILNPVSSGGKGRKLYEEYCAPLLHLAGFKVSVKLTEAEGEAKDLMEIMSNTDAVLVAGGDGTIMEAVTGMMRREDVEKFRVVPIGVLPVGENNTLANRLFSGSDKIRVMAEATMSVVRQLKKPLSVLELENLSEEERYRGKKIYGVNSLEMGAWREAYARREKYWLFAGLKHRLTYLLSYLTGHADVHWDWPLGIEYTTSSLVESEVVEQPQGALAWFHKPRTVRKMEERLERVNRGLWTGAEIDFRLMDRPHVEDGNQKQSVEARLYAGPVQLSDFVREGWRRLKRETEGDVTVVPEIIQSDNFYITPSLAPGESRSLALDGEEIDLTGPVRLSLLRDRLTVFCREAESKPEPKPEDSNGMLRRRWGAIGSSASLVAANKHKLG